MGRTGVHRSVLAARFGVLVLSALLLQCVAGDPDAVGRHEAAIRDPSVWRFYEVQVPRRQAPDLVEEGFGLFPSSALHEETAGRGQWYVVLLDDHQLERLRERGFDPHRAARGALRREVRAELEPGRDPDAELETLSPDPDCEHRDDFCQYRGPGPCPEAQSIMKELMDIASTHAAFARFVVSPESWEGRLVYGLRIGPTPRHTDPDDPTPQVLVFGAQHAREWAASGLVMNLVRRFVDLYLEGGEVFDLLQDRAILFVPVANPDGYVHTFVDPDTRLWRKTRRPCTEQGTPCRVDADCRVVGHVCVEEDDGSRFCRLPCSDEDPCRSWRQTCYRDHCYTAGVDLNRNFPFNWSDTRRACSDLRYEGRSAGSEPETATLDRIFLNDFRAAAGAYVTRFYVNYHSYGGFVLYPDGISGGDGAGGMHRPCRSAALLPENCQPPEFAALRWIAGTEAAPQLADEWTHVPYRTDALYRALEGIPGDQHSHHTYSPFIRDFDPERDRRSLGVGIEVTNSEFGFLAECIPERNWNSLVWIHTQFLPRVLSNLDALSTDGGLATVPELGSRTGRRIHRLRSDVDDDDPQERHGPPRFWIDQANFEGDSIEISPPTGFAVGLTGPWRTSGLFYRTFYWKNDEDPFRFPPHFEVCGPTGGCERNDTDGETDLCSSRLFDLGDGWRFVPLDDAPRADDCYFELTGRGAGAFTLTRARRSIPEADLVHLDYSYRINPNAFEPHGGVIVIVDSRIGGQEVVRRHPARLGTGIPKPSDGRIRTENVDLPDVYDFGRDIRIRFEARGVKRDLGGEDFSFRVYDVILIGRHRG